MKKKFAMAAALALTLSAVSMNVLSASAEDPQVYVSISNDKRELVLTEEPIALTDADNDGKLTINDAFINTHESKFEGGAAAGYKTSV